MTRVKAAEASSEKQAQDQEVEERRTDHLVVEDNGEPSSPQPASSLNNHHSSSTYTAEAGWFSSSRNVIILAIGASFFCGAILGGLVGWGATKQTHESSSSSSNNKQNAVPASTPSPTPQDAPTLDSSDSTGNPALFASQQALKEFLASISPDQGTALDQAGSPQRLAFEWLWDDGSDQMKMTYSELEIMQRYVLATLYYATNGAGWNDPLGFLSPQQPVCEWDVSDGYIPTWHKRLLRSLSEHEFHNPCNEFGSLTSLSIGKWSGNDLSGTLPAELSLLTDLQTFRFGGERALYGTLPTELGRLTKLRDFAVFGSQISGPIPSEFGSFELLDYFDVSNNHLQGELPTELGRMTHLDLFSIAQNPGIIGTIPTEYGGMRNLESFTVHATGLTGIFPEEVCNIRNGRVTITTRCELDELLICCDNVSSCGGSDGGTVGYGSGSLCENVWDRPDSCESICGFVNDQI